MSPADKRREATSLRAVAAELRSVSKGVALAGKLVPDALLAEAAVLVPAEAKDALKPLLDRLVELAGDRTADLVARLDKQIAANESRADALEQFALELEGTAATVVEAVSEKLADEPSPPVA